MPMPASVGQARWQSGFSTSATLAAYAYASSAPTGMPSAGARSAAHSCSWSAGLPLAWVSIAGTGSPAGGGTPSGIGVPSCHEQLEAISSAVAPITATARSQSTGDTGLPQTPLVAIHRPMARRSARRTARSEPPVKGRQTIFRCAYPRARQNVVMFTRLLRGGSMKLHLAWPVSVAAAALVLAGCSSSDSGSTEESSASSSASETSTSAAAAAEPGAREGGRRLQGVRRRPGRRARQGRQGVHRRRAGRQPEGRAGRVRAVAPAVGAHRAASPGWSRTPTPRPTPASTTSPTSTIRPSPAGTGSSTCCSRRTPPKVARRSPTSSTPTSPTCRSSCRASRSSRSTSPTAPPSSSKRSPKASSPARKIGTPRPTSGTSTPTCRVRRSRSTS